MPQLSIFSMLNRQEIQILGDPLSNSGISTYVMKTDTPGLVRFRHPLTERFLSHDKAETEGGDEFQNKEAHNPCRFDLSFESDGNTLNAVFGLVPIDDTELTKDFLEMAFGIGEAASEGLRAKPLLRRLHLRLIENGLVESLIRAMPRNEMIELSRELLYDKDSLSLLSGYAPNDHWLTTVLPQLLRWNKARRANPNIAVSPVEDEVFLRPAVDSRPPQTGLVLNSLARRHVLPQRSACILVTVRNEGAYLLDWLAYHLAIGFEHVFLYSNQNEDGSDEMLQLLARHGLITWCRNDCGQLLGAQDKAYAHALTSQPGILDFRWAAVIDIDEYITLDSKLFTTIDDFLSIQEINSVDAIGLSWAMYVAFPNQRWTDQSSTTRFEFRTREVDEHIKSLIRPQKFWSSHPHFPKSVLNLPFEFRTAAGGYHYHPVLEKQNPAIAKAPLAEHAWISHYFLRTAEEAMWKWHRGRANLANESEWFLDYLSNWFLQMHLSDKIVRDTRIHSFSPLHNIMLEKLNMLPGVAECGRQLKSEFRSRLVRLRSEFLGSAPTRIESEAVRQFRQVLQAVSDAEESSFSRISSASSSITKRDLPPKKGRQSTRGKG